MVLLEREAKSPGMGGFKGKDKGGGGGSYKGKDKDGLGGKSWGRTAGGDFDSGYIHLDPHLPDGSAGLDSGPIPPNAGGGGPNGKGGGKKGGKGFQDSWGREAKHQHTLQTLPISAASVPKGLFVSRLVHHTLDFLPAGDMWDFSRKKGAGMWLALNPLNDPCDEFTGKDGLPEIQRRTLGQHLTKGYGHASPLEARILMFGSSPLEDILELSALTEAEVPHRVGLMNAGFSAKRKVAQY